MAWTTPASWSVGELVTASKLNTHLKANLEYLKGAAGTITLDADLAVTRSAAGATVGAYVDNTGGSSSGTLSRFTLGMTPAETNALLLQFDHNANEASVFNRASGGNLVLQTNNANTIFQTNGVGLSVTAPQGKLHGYNTISGFLAWEYNGLDGTARTILANGAGDVAIAIHGMFICYNNTSGTFNTGAGSATGLINGGLPLAPGAAAFNLYNSGGETVQFVVAANGAVTVQRTAGTATFKVVLWLQWM